MEERIVESLEFRDIMLYLVPGTLTLIALGLLAEGFSPQIWQNVAKETSVHSWTVLLASVILSYGIGHALLPLSISVSDSLRGPLGLMTEKLPEKPPKKLPYTKRQRDLRQGIRDRKDIKEALRKYRYADPDKELEDNNWPNLIGVLDKSVKEKAPKTYQFYVARQQTMQWFLMNMSLSSGLVAVSFLPLVIRSALAISRSYSLGLSMLFFLAASSLSIFGAKPEWTCIKKWWVRLCLGVPLGFCGILALLHWLDGCAALGTTLLAGFSTIFFSLISGLLVRRHFELETIGDQAIFNTFVMLVREKEKPRKAW